MERGGDGGGWRGRVYVYSPAGTWSQCEHSNTLNTYTSFKHRQHALAWGGCHTLTGATLKPVVTSTGSAGGTQSHDYMTHIESKVIAFNAEVKH